MFKKKLCKYNQPNVPKESKVLVLYLKLIWSSWCMMDGWMDAWMDGWVSFCGFCLPSPPPDKVFKWQVWRKHLSMFIGVSDYCFKTDLKNGEEPLKFTICGCVPVCIQGMNVGVRLKRDHVMSCAFIRWRQQFDEKQTESLLKRVCTYFDEG